MTQSITSDRDYLELVDSDDLLISATTTPPPDTDARIPQTILQFPTNYGGGSTVDHTVGSVPIVRAWIDSDKNGRLYNTQRHTTGDYLAIVQRPTIVTVATTTQVKLLVLSPVSETGVPVHYRIYRFGDKGLTSDERIDRIFDKDSETKTLSAAADSFSPVAATTTIAHGKSEQILWKLQFSQDGSTWYDEGVYLFGAPDTSTGPPGGPYTNFYYETAYASADSTNFYVTYVHNYTGSRTIRTRWVWEYK